MQIVNRLSFSANVVKTEQATGFIKKIGPDVEAAFDELERHAGSDSRSNTSLVLDLNDQDELSMSVEVAPKGRIPGDYQFPFQEKFLRQNGSSLSDKLVLLYEAALSSLHKDFFPEQIN